MSKPAMVVFALAFTSWCILALAAPGEAAAVGKSMTAKNKVTVNRYFSEALDQGRPEIVDDLFTKDCTIYRPGMEPFQGSESVRLIVTFAHKIYSSFHTTINNMVAEGDFVAVHLTHNAVYRGEWKTRLGTFDCINKKTQWEALVLFKMQDGKIAEERVFRDELGMMLEVGILAPPE